MATRTTRRAARAPRSSTGARPRRAAARRGADTGRADWKGHIAFGLVEIPVTLRTAEKRSERVRFHLIDRRDRSPVGNQRVSKATGEPVPWSEIVKGYEHEKGEYVLLDDTELQRANPEASRTIQILDFVDATAVHPVYFSEPYHVLPARAKGNRAYALLRQALERSGKIGVATVVLRTRQHLAALLPRGPVLALVLMRYGQELAEPASLPLPDELSDKLPPKELEMADRLIESMSGSFAPGRYKDTWHTEVMALIERKIRSGRTGPVRLAEADEDEERVAPVTDLMPLLERSLGARGRRAPARRKAPPRAHRKSA
jgi:DNA end-binding protein Ku